MVPVEKAEPEESPRRPVRIGIANGEYEIPDDFDHMLDKEIAEMFGLDE